MTRNSLDLCWLAGILEGEGCFTIQRSRYPVVIVQMTDRDVVERVQRIAGAGRVEQLAADQRPNRKPVWRWQVFSEDAVGVMMTVYGRMGQRRQARIREVLAAWRSTPGHMWGRTMRAERERLAHDGKRRCPKCLTIRSLDQFDARRGGRCKPCRSEERRAA